jgi:hypothetical protein
MAKCKSTPFTASGQVAHGSEVVYHGYTVTTATATAAILIRKGTSASGQIVDSIPASTAAGTTKYLSDGISCEGGLYFDINGATGTVNVLYES